MPYVIELNVGTKEQPAMLYYCGYNPNGFPPGPKMIADPRLAFHFDTQTAAGYVLAADERLKGGKILEIR